jgi:hypothetical protein
VNDKTFTYPFTINVGNKKSGLYGEYGWLGDLDYSKDAYPMDVGCSTEFDFLAQPDDEDFVVTVKGLPAGMKWDPETGIVSGTPTKTGVYTITVLTTCYGGKFTEEDTVTMNVNALPDWVVGTFYGSVITDNGDWGWESAMEAKVTSAGKVTLTLKDCDGLQRSPAVSNLYLRDGQYCFDFEFRTSYEQSAGTCCIKRHDSWYVGELIGYESGFDDEDEYFAAEWHGYQDVYGLSSTNIVRPVFKTDNKLEIPIDEDGSIMLTFGAKGLVTVSEPGHDVDWSTSHLLPVKYSSSDGVVVTASLWLMGYDAGEDMSFGAEFILRIPVSQDGTAKASEISIEDVFAGPNW